MSTAPSDQPTVSPVKKKNFFARHKALTIVGGIVILIVVIAIAASAGGGQKTGDGAVSSGVSPTPTKPAGPGLNTPVTSGDLEFTALSVAEAGTVVGTSPLTETAHGKFVAVTVHVTNVSKSPQPFIVTYLQLTDATGRTFDADSVATIYAAPDAGTWISSINPGNSVDGPVVFDIPADAVPTALVVKGSLLSGSETIALKSAASDGTRRTRGRCGETASAPDRSERPNGRLGP